jgi:hypothetical protein
MSVARGVASEKSAEENQCTEGTQASIGLTAKIMTGTFGSGIPLLS